MNRLLVSTIAGLVAFLLWMSQVGNPHVVETVIGVVIGLAVFIACYRWLGKFQSRRQQGARVVYEGDRRLGWRRWWK